MISTWLNRPFPLLGDQKIAIAQSLVVGLVSFIILTVFRPSGLDEVDNVTYLLGFGGNAVFALVIHLLLGPRLLPNVFNEDQWTIGSQVILTVSVLLLISTCNYIYNSTIGLDFSPQYSLLYFVYMTTAVGMLPIMIIVYVTELVARKRNQLTANSIELDNGDSNTQQLTIRSENVSEPVLVIKERDLIYARADGNYTRLITKNGGSHQVHHLRLSLKSLQQQIQENEAFVRCHKSYLVNKYHIVNIKGNARSMVAHLPCIDAAIPISRGIDLNLFGHSV